MSGAGDRRPWDVNRLEDPLGVAAVALAQWEARRPDRPDPWARAEAARAEAALAVMASMVDLMRDRLRGEIAAYDETWTRPGE
jgi:hypothetical protein